MAELSLDGDELVLSLTTLEKAEAVHGDLRAPLSALQGLEVLDDAHGAADTGFKLGTRVPGVVEVATIRSQGRRVFAVVQRDTPRGVRVSLGASPYDEWIVGCSNPEAVIERLRAKS